MLELAVDPSLPTGRTLRLFSCRPNRSCSSLLNTHCRFLSLLRQGPRLRARMRHSTFHESRCAVQSSAFIDGTMSLQQGSMRSVAAHLSIGLTEPRHRHSRVVYGAPEVRGYRQDSVRSVVLDLHQASSARGGAPCSNCCGHSVINSQI
jgi:hypothetical protein